MKTQLLPTLFVSTALLTCLQGASALAAAKLVNPPTSNPAAEQLQEPAAKNAVELDERAFEGALGAGPAKPIEQLNPREAAEFGEAHGIEMRQRALGFLAQYPNDPHRWLVVSLLDPDSPRFVLEWAPENADKQVEPAKVDQAAAAAWRAKVAALQAKLNSAVVAWQTKVAALQGGMRTDDALPSEVEVLFNSVRRQNLYYDKWKSGKAMAPDFTTYTLDNTPVKVSDYRGKVVVLDFWATWCGPCVAGLPHLQALADRYKTRGVVVLSACTLDTRAAFEKFVKANVEKYPNIIFTNDKEEHTDKASSKLLYGMDAPPTWFLINRTGHVVDAQGGYYVGEVILDGALAKAGIAVNAATLAQAKSDLKKRGGGGL